MDRTRQLVDDVARHERMLRRRVGARSLDGRDPSLTALLRKIEERRARRSPPTGSRSATASPPPSGESTQVRILAVEPYGPTVRVLRIERPSDLSFRAGQHLRVGVPDGRRERFSIASAPHEPHLDLAIERREGGRVTPALFARRVGDLVEVGDRTKGDLRLDPSASCHLLVATVTGIAPLRSMLRDALHHGSDATFTVLLGASHAVELPFHEELVGLAASEPRVTYVPSVSRPGAPTNRGWRGRTGRIDVVARELARRFDPGSTHVYAVGNAGMTANVRRDLGGAGFAVSTESYGG